MTRAVDVERRGVRVNGRSVGVGSAIPDTVVSRPADTFQSNTGQTSDIGLVFETSQEWPDIQLKISTDTNTASDDTAVIERDSDGVEVQTADASDLSGGAVVTVSDANLSANTKYRMFLRNSNGNQWGQYDSASFPYTSTDGNLSITAGWFIGSERTSDIYGISQIGNINL